MRKTLIFCVSSLLFIGQTYAGEMSVLPSQLPVATSFRSVPSVNATYNVRIKLVRTDGTPVDGSQGLHGFWARNEQTGGYFETTDREGSEFEGLPGGTYTFGAYPGNWEGAVPKTLTLDNSQVGPDGFIEVTLVYWVE